MRLFHTALSVMNLEKSRKFYENVFDLKFRNTARSEELEATFLQLEDEEGNFVELFEHDSPHPLHDDLMDFQKNGIKHISFIVQNLEAVINSAIDNGGTVIRAPQSGKTVKRNAFIGDPDGIPIELVEL